MTRIKNSFSTFDWLNKLLWHIVNILQSRLKYFGKNILKTISTRLARHHLQRFSASDAAASSQCMFCVSWIAIALALFKQCLICIQIFGSLFSNVIMRDANLGTGGSISSRISFTHRHKTYTEHIFRAWYWYSHSIIFNLCLIIQNQGIWKISSFYCLIRCGFSCRYTYRLYH